LLQMNSKSRKTSTMSIYISWKIGMWGTAC